MKLSRLIFDCIKYVKYLDDKNFTYDSFKEGNFSSDDLDYSITIENIFSPFNSAIHRLSDLNKIPTISVKLPPMDENGMIDLSQLEKPVKSISNVFDIKKGVYTHVPFRQLGAKTLAILGSYYVKEGKELYIEYREDIKNFSKVDISDETLDIDLNTFGINETMCSYIIEYCKGKLYETIDPNMAAYHNNLAEQYFAGLDDQITNFNQQNIVKKWRVE